MKTSKFLSITTLAILSLLLTAFTWAFWSSNVSGNKTNHANTITLGQANTATTEVSLVDSSIPSGKTLVPVNRSSVSTGDSVESVEYTFLVKWSGTLSKTSDGTPGTLVVSNTKNTFSDAEYDFETVKVVTSVANNGKIVVDGDAVLVTATVTLNEPTSQSHYDAVAGKVLKSYFEFTVTPDAN